MVFFFLENALKMLPVWVKIDLISDRDESVLEPGKH